ncbi:glycosyltransferase [Crossiella sp. SN42]|uniref:glycosyltransferase n=1 Tax=Crossiella sp. SN42 TaxID=2944808 RepID=UPI00207C6C64|nr:glycosyltransferase [Crossiella sp. SN42]MCO1580336.1 glycosyltransferase [Crossiella sp. SN42]
MPAEPLRILFTTQQASGHLRPLIPIAQEAAARGHDVRVGSTERLRAEVTGFGLTLHPAGYEWGPDLLPLLPAGYHRFGFAEAADALTALTPAVTALFAGPAARATARDILAADWHPQLVVREADEFGGYLAAEALGIPHVSVASFGGLDGIRGPDLAPVLDLGRAELGLTPDPAGERLYHWRHATFVPEAYGAAEFILPRTKAFRHANVEQRRGRLPDWLTELPADRPFVFAGFGTVVYELPGAQAFLREVLAALGAVDCTAVLAVGAGHDPADLGRPPPNVRLTDFVDQALMLEGCDLFLTHGGLNSVKEALRLGVPMAGVGPGADHRHNLRMCAKAGVAEVVDVHEATTDNLAAAMRTVLTQPRYRARSRWLQRHLHALPPVAVLVDELEELA